MRYPVGEGSNVTRPLLRGRPGDWPLAGHVLGGRAGTSRDGEVYWAGRVGGGAPLDVAWRASRILEQALRGGARREGGARSTLQAVWEALESIVPSELGPELGRDLSLLLAARDAEGLLVSAVGVGRVDVLNPRQGGRLRPWLEGDHPLLGPPGLPERSPGALQLQAGPSWLVGTVWGEAAPDSQGEGEGALLSRCGVHL